MDTSSPLVKLTADDGSTVKLQFRSTAAATYSVGNGIWFPVSPGTSSSTVVALVPGDGITITGNTISAISWEDLRV